MAGILIDDEAQRLALHQRFGAGSGLPKENRAVVAITIDVIDNEGNEIGYIQSINRTAARAIDRLRHLNVADAGRTIELGPHPVDTTLAVTGFCLYDKTETDKGSLLNRLPGETAAAFQCMQQQAEYFNLRVREVHPNPDAPGVVEHETHYIGCLLSNSTHPIALGTLHIAETADITVSWPTGPPAGA